MRSAAGTRLARWTWGLCCAAGLVGAIGVQMDRESRRNPSVAASVLAPFRAYALEVLAKGAYTRGDADRGLALSRQLVSRRPVPAESLSLLTNGLLASGQADAALPALLQAAQRGWRDRYTQHLMVLAAGQNGDWDVVGQRLVALWGQGDRGAEVRDLSAEVLSEPQAVMGFINAARDGRVVWANDFLGWAAGALPSQTVDRVSHALATRHPPIDCAAMAGRSASLVQAGKGQIAAVLWQRFCGSAVAANDFGFDVVGDAAGPFGWRLGEQAGLTAEVVSDAGRQVLQYENTDPLRVTVVTRLAVLSPGSYSVKAEGAGKDHLRLKVTCMSGAGVHRVVSDQTLDRAEPVLLPSTDCPVQSLAITAPQGAGQIAGLAISSSRP